MSILRRSPSLESISSVRSLESMQFIDSAKSFSSALSPGGEKDKSSDYGGLNDMDMGRTITSASIVPPVVDGDVEKPSPTDDGPPNTCDDERELAPNSGVEPTAVHNRQHDRFYIDSRTIKLVLDDGTLYRVFRQSFAAHSTLFAEEYLAGCGDDEVIKLPGVSSVDLDRILSLMYPSELATCELSSAQDWISVLRLAHRWSFPTLQVRALREIELVGNTVDKIVAAREFTDMEELQGWLLPAFKEACSAPGWLRLASLQDAERMGAGTILAIARIREEAREAEEGTYDVEQAVVAEGLAPGPAAKKTCTTSQADVLRSMFSGRPVGLTDAMFGEDSLSATAGEPSTLAPTVPASSEAKSPRMAPHREDVPWTPTMAPWSTRSIRRGAPGDVSEVVSSTPATFSRMKMANEHEEALAPPLAAEAPPDWMPAAAPSLSGFETQLSLTPRAESWSTLALASAPTSCSASAMSTDEVAPPPIVADQPPCATSLPGSAPSPLKRPRTMPCCVMHSTAASSAPMSPNGAPCSAEGSVSRPTATTIGEIMLSKSAKKRLQKARRENKLREQENERRAEAARTVSATSVTESADSARKDEQAGYPALACNTAGAKGQVEEPHAAVAVP